MTDTGLQTLVKYQRIFSKIGNKKIVRITLIIFVNKFFITKRIDIKNRKYKYDYVEKYGTPEEIQVSVFLEFK